MEYKIYNCGSYNVHTIKTDKFKNCAMEIIFRKEIKKEDITIDNMLVDMLTHSSKKYPKRRDVSIEFENLYNASVRGISSKLGNSYMLSFVTDFLNPKYCEEGYLEDVIHLPFEFILKPNIINGKFDERSFNIIKNRLQRDIEAAKENASRYAMRRSLINMDDKSVSSYSMLGDIESLNRITTSNLVKQYKKLFTDYECDIYVIGNLDMNYVVSLIKDNFKLDKSMKNDISLYAHNSCRKEILDVLETGKYEQDSFIMIYNLDRFTKRERDYVVQLFNVIFGNGGLTCKLYKYLREDNSLCYTVSSMYQKYDNLLMIYAGIDKKDKKLCIELVTKALDEMINGDFTKEELDNAKKMIVSSIRMNEDSLGGIINNYLFNNIDNLDLFDKRIKGFETVTKEEIVNVAKKIKLNTIYMLAGEDK